MPWTDHPVRRAALVAAAAVAVTSSGDVVLLAVLLGLAAGDLMAAAAASLALVALAVLWGSTSLDAISGAQAVLGPGGLVGPAVAAVATWAAGVALVFAGPRRWEAAAFGASAALAVAGPSIADAGDLVVRAAGTGLGVTAAVLAGEWAGVTVCRRAALAVATGAVVLAVAS